MSRLRYLPHVWAVLLTVLLLGPALAPGYVLTYDMVWVPDLALRSDFLGWGSALPRAVPSDAVVAVLDAVVPGMVLQKLVLVGALLAAAGGMLRLVGTSLVARLVAVTLTVWNPFTVERLGIGHWTVLLGYGVLPWLVVAASRSRASRSVRPALWLLLPLGSLSASAGLVSAVTVLVTGGELTSWPGRRSTLRLGLLCVASQAPWVVAGLLHAGAAAQTSGFGLFGLHAEGSLPAPVAALTLGGIWNSQVVPLSRDSFLAWGSVVLLLVLAPLGARRWWAQLGAGLRARVVVLWAVGLGAALLTWSSPGAVAWLAGAVPGAGVLRDGTRSLALCLPLWAGIQAAGADELCRRAASGDRLVRGLLGGICAVLPVALMYDAAWGLSGGLRAVDYPPSWADTRRVVSSEHGDVLLLPFSAYRAPTWNHGRTVLDPVGRYLRPDYLASDTLLVGGHVVRGEDPRAAAAARALAVPDPSARDRALEALGIGYVVTEKGSSRLGVRVLPGVRHGQAHRTVVDRIMVSGSWLAFAAVSAVGVGLQARRGLAGLRRRRPGPVA